MYAIYILYINRITFFGDYFMFSFLTVFEVFFYFRFLLSTLLDTYEGLRIDYQQQLYGTIICIYRERNNREMIKIRSYTK